MVFLVNDDHITYAMNNATAFLSTSATISWPNVNGSSGGCGGGVGGGAGGGGGSNDANASGGEGNGANFSVCNSNLTDEAVLLEQLVSKATLGKVTLAFGLVLIPLFALVGVVGNILSLVVLVQHRMRSTINLCLAALAVSDLLLLLHSLAFSAMRIYGQHDPDGADRARVTTYPVLGAYGSIVSARITTWLTTMLGVERCIAVYFPMKAKAINSRRSTLLAITTIYLITIVAFLPTTLQYQVVWVVTPRNQTKPKLELSHLGQNHRFMIPYSLALNILFRFIPLVILVVVNALITVAIRRTHAMRRNMSWGSGVGGGLSDGGGGASGGGGGVSGRGHGSGHEQNRITMMLLTVSVVFLVCTLPGAINTIVSRITAHYSRLGAQGNLYMTLSLVTYFLETLNSSVNFVIYMAFSRKFCHTYQEIFCRRSKHWKMSLRTVRFTPRGGGVGGGAAGAGVGSGGGIGGGRGLAGSGGGSGRGGGASSSTPHEMYCMQYRPLTPATHSPVNNHHHHHSSSSGGGSHPRARFIISNGFARSSFDVDDVQLIGNGMGKRGVSNGGLPMHGACCTCHLGNRSHSLSHSRSQSRSRSRSHSHSSDSAAQQYS